jgi:hypothetical protein
MSVTEVIFFFFENCCPPTRLAQANAIAAQETWFTHFHPRPWEDVDPDRIFVIFFSFSTQMLGIYFEIRHNHFLPHPFQSLIMKVVDAGEADLLTTSLTKL